MGKIKETVLAKKDRPRTEPKPPSMRRLKRSKLRAKDRSGLFGQVIPAMLVFRFKSKYAPTKTITHKHYSDERTDETSERKVEQFSCKADDSDSVRYMEELAGTGVGKISVRKAKTIWHRVDMQDNYYKPSKPHYKGNTGRRSL